MTYIYAETMDRARSVADALGLRPSRVHCVGNASRSEAGRMYWPEDVVHILPGVSREQRQHIRLNLLKSRHRPLVVDHEHP